MVDTKGQTNQVGSLEGGWRDKSFVYYFIRIQFTLRMKAYLLKVVRRGSFDIRVLMMSLLMKSF